MFSVGFPIIIEALHTHFSSQGHFDRNSNAASTVNNQVSSDLSLREIIVQCHEAVTHVRCIASYNLAAGRPKTRHHESHVSANSALQGRCSATFNNDSTSDPHGTLVRLLEHCTKSSSVNDISSLYLVIAYSTVLNAYHPGITLSTSKHHHPQVRIDRD